jgi:hypothetical protein
MNFGHTSVTVDILFKYWMSKYELFVFLWFFRCCFVDSNKSGKQVSFQKNCDRPSLDRSTTPAFSPPPPPVAPLAFAALSPPQPCSSPAPPLPAWRQWRERGYWCSDVRLANLKTVDADPSMSSPAMMTSRPPQATSRRGSGPSDHHENN